MPIPDPSPFAPLPGTVPSPRAFFIDRWGTLLVEPKRICRRFEDVEFVEGAIDALFRASGSGWRIYLLGNEDAVARGRLRTEDWHAIEAGILAHLEGHGVAVARSYACLTHPGGRGKHRQDSVYLLPNTGAFYHAVHADGVDLARSWVIGDSTLELVAGWRAGCRLAGVRTGQGLADETFEVTPEFVAEDLSEALLTLLSLEGVAQR